MDQDELKESMASRGTRFYDDLDYVQYMLVRFPEEQKWSRKESELYIAKQVELLQSVENAADSPEKIDEIVGKIMKSNPDLAEVHFLQYLNSMRVNEYCQAMHQLR